jgi:hypothetical protein
MYVESRLDVGGFGAFNGPPLPAPPPPPPLPPASLTTANNSNYHHHHQYHPQPYGRQANPMGMNNHGFGLNPMQQNQPYGGMKHPSNQTHNGNMSKRSRPNSGSWDMMGGNGSHHFNHDGLQQQKYTGGHCYQDQSYNSSQQSSIYR